MGNTAPPGLVGSHMQKKHDEKVLDIRFRIAIIILE